MWDRYSDQKIEYAKDKNPGPHRVILPFPKVRELDKQGNLTWNEGWQCECCGTSFVIEEAPYEFCDGCGCFTTVYLKRLNTQYEMELLCQECIKSQPR